MANTVRDSIVTYLRETIDQGITESLPGICPVASEILKTSKGVVRDSLGRGWAVKHTYEGALCGTHEWMAATGGATVMDGNNTGTPMVYAAGRGWPGLSDMSGPALIQRTISLVEGRGNYPIPIEIMQTDLQDAAVGSLVSLTKKNMAKRINLSQVHAFWKLNSQNAIGAFTGDGQQINTTTARTLTLTEGRIRNFYPGLMIRIYSDNNGPDARVGSSDSLIVVAVNYLKKQIKVQAVAGTCTPQNGNKHWLLPRNSNAGTSSATAELSNCVEGLIDWHKASGTLFGGSLDLSLFPQFSSINDQTFSGPLTSDHLNLLIGGFNEAYGMPLDTIIMTNGMQLAFLQNVTDTQQLLRYEVQGAAPKVVGGWAGMGYMYDGKVYKIMTSPCAHTGKLWILKLGDNNYRKYVPPRLPGATSGGEAGAQEVEFVGEVLGYARDIFGVPLASTGAPSDRLQAPYTVKMQYAPEQVQAICAGVFDEWLYTA